MNKLILISFLSFIFSSTLYADKVFLQFGTGNQVDKNDSATLADVKVEYGDYDWRELQFDPATHEPKYNKVTGLFEAYSLVDKAAAKQSVMDAKEADKAAIKQKYATIFGLTKEQMDEFAGALK